MVGKLTYVRHWGLQIMTCSLIGDMLILLYKFQFFFTLPVDKMVEIQESD